MYLAIKAPSRSLKTLFSAQTQHKVTWQVTQHSLTEIRKPELSTTTNHKEPVRTQNQNKETLWSVEKLKWSSRIWFKFYTW